MNEDEITKQLKKVFLEIQLPEHARNEVVASLMEDDEKANRVNREKLTHVEAEISRSETRIQRNYDAYIDGDVAKEMYAKKDAELKASKKALEKTRKNIELVAKNNYDWAFSLLDLSRRASDIFENGENDERRVMINQILSNLELDDNLLRWKIKNHTILWLFVTKLKIGWA